MGEEELHYGEDDADSQKPQWSLHGDGILEKMKKIEKLEKTNTSSAWFCMRWNHGDGALPCDDEPKHLCEFDRKTQASLDEPGVGAGEADLQEGVGGTGRAEDSSGELLEVLHLQPVQTDSGLSAPEQPTSEANVGRMSHGNLNVVLPTDALIEGEEDLGGGMAGEGPGGGSPVPQSQAKSGSFSAICATEVFDQMSQRANPVRNCNVLAGNGSVGAGDLPIGTGLAVEVGTPSKAASSPAGVGVGTSVAAARGVSAFASAATD